MTEEMRIEEQLAALNGRLERLERQLADVELRCPRQVRHFSADEVDHHFIQTLDGHSDWIVQRMTRALGNEGLAMALPGLSKELLLKVKRNVSTTAWADMVPEMKASPTRSRTVHWRRRFLEGVESLEGQGMILPRGDADEAGLISHDELLKRVQQEVEALRPWVENTLKQVE